METWIVGLFALLSCVTYTENSQLPSTVHRQTEFAFDVSAPFQTVVPLFGSDKERLWAEGWNPHFVYPQPANDQAGAVFTIDAGHSNVWINTIYDLDQGHIQYACFAAEGMVTLIDIRVQRSTSDTTRVIVVYERTALRPEANDHVNRVADNDKAKGPEWEAALRSYLQKLGGIGNSKP